jgi:hypothetical protein
MKKIVSTADLGGAPFTKADLRTVFNDEIWDALEAMLSPYTSDTEGLIISGCTVTNPALGVYIVSSGIVFLNGQFMRLPTGGVGLALPLYIAPKAVADDDRVFVDTSTKTLFQTSDAEVVTSIPGSGQYIKIASLADPDDRRWSTLEANKNITTLSGTYTPTLSNTTNVTSSTAFLCQYSRVDATVTVSGRVTIDPTLALTSTLLGLSIPIVSNFGANAQLSGVAFCPSVFGYGAAIRASAINDAAIIEFIADSGAASVDFYFTLTYQII